MEIVINYLAVLLAAVASMAVGFAWYSPAVLGKPWMKLKGYTEASLKKEQKQMGKWYAVSFVLALLTADMLAHVAFFSNYFFNQGLLSAALSSGLFVWIGFIMPVQATAQIFGEKKWKLLAIDTGYQLAAVFAMALIIGWMG